MNDHVEAEELDESRVDQPDSDLLYSTVPPPAGIPGTVARTLGAQGVSDHSKTTAIMTLVLFGGALFAILAVGIVYVYLVHLTPSSYRLVASDGTVATPTPPKVAPRPTPILGRTATGELIPVSADDLHVTSIALGALHLGIVNGKRLAEGDWLQIKSPLGVTYVQLVGLEDGVAHFNYGEQPIDAKLQLTLGPKKSPGPEPIAQAH